MLKRLFKIISMVIGGLCLGVMIAFLFGWIVMLLWNWLMPPIFNLPVITFWQAWGLVILTHILFKGGQGHDHDHHAQPPWKEHFKKKIKAHLSENKKGSADTEQTAENPA